MTRPVAVIDIGSNSIKALVVRVSETGARETIFWRTLDTRISAGISGPAPRLSEASIEAGVNAVKILQESLKPFEPCDLSVVATSAVREAENGQIFSERVRAATGLTVRILSGLEEANYIGRGLRCDPALSAAKDFYLFDLGGGSLECLAFQEGKIVQARSLPLGCVRLTESCLRDSAQPIEEADLNRIAETTRRVLRESGFTFSLPPEAISIGTGGTLTTARAVQAARQGRSLDAIPSEMTVSELRSLLVYVGRCALPDRGRIPALPPARADVFPTALATLVVLAETGGLPSYWVSNYNLRWGVVDERLAALSPTPPN